MKIEQIAKNAKRDLIVLKKNFIIIKNISKNKKILKNKALKISNSLGKLVPQSNKGNYIQEIKPSNKQKKLSKKLIKEKLRYHQTNLGGSIHTDGPQLHFPPKYVVMVCLKQAKLGGYSTLVNMRKIYNFLKHNRKQILKNLQQNYFFEKRGFQKRNKSKVLSKPIFRINKKKINFRYLREYIEAGHRIKNKVLNSSQLKSLNYLDKLLMNKKFTFNFKLNTGDLIVLNNDHIAHGRTKFSLEKNSSRTLIRIWVR